LGTFKTSKGAPIAILALCPDTPSEIVQQFNHDNEAWSRRGIRSMAIARTNPDGKWILQGMLSFKDPARKDSKETIYRAREFGIAIKMITGDNFLIAKEMAKELDMGPLVRNAHGLPELDRETKEKPKDLKAKYSDMILATDVFSQVFPEHKYLIVECLRELEYKVGMTGDGVNDAPALKRADVGVAVSGATEAAQSAAAIVLTKVGLSTIVTGIVVARCIFVRIRNFLTYRIAATLQLLVFFFIAVFWFKPVSFEPSFDIFFHMPVLMLMLITLLNDGTLIAIGYDNVVPQQMPEKWNIKALFAVSSMLALIALISSLLLLWMLLDSNTAGSWFQGLGIGGLSYGQVTNAIYLKISVSDFLTLFSARTGGDWFWSAAPAGVLLAAGAVALSISTALATWWPEGHVDEIAVLGLGLRAPKLLSLWIWLYCLFWWFIQDACKVYLVRTMSAYNWFGYNDTGKLVVPQSALDWAEENKNDPEATSYHC
jgi:H+-transporting ATPase